jgi:superfamily II DNA/RNA helicase
VNEGTNIIIGTPFRIHQLLLKGYLNKNLVKMIIIDEADSILIGN